MPSSSGAIGAWRFCLGIGSSARELTGKPIE